MQIFHKNTDNVVNWTKVFTFWCLFFFLANSTNRNFKERYIRIVKWFVYLIARISACCSVDADDKEAVLKKLERRKPTYWSQVERHTRR